MDNAFYEAILNSPEVEHVDTTGGFKRPKFIRDFNWTYNAGDMIYCLYEEGSEFKVIKQNEKTVDVLDHDQKLRTFHLDSTFNRTIANQLSKNLELKVKTGSKKNNTSASLPSGNYYIAKIKKKGEKSGVYLVDYKGGLIDNKRFINVSDLKQHFSLDRVSRPLELIDEFKANNQGIRKVWSFNVEK